MGTSNLPNSGNASQQNNFNIITKDTFLSAEDHPSRMSQNPNDSNPPNKDDPYNNAM